MSMDVLTVTLNLDIINYLGISIVGQSSLKGDNGIYVANVIKGQSICSFFSFTSKFNDEVLLKQVVQLH